MAAQSIELYASGLSSIFINYDDVTLVVSGVTMTCASTMADGSPNPYSLNFFWSHGASLHALQCFPGTSGIWPAPGNSIQGTMVTNSHGFQTVDFGFIAPGAGLGANFPSGVGQVVTVG